VCTPAEVVDTNCTQKWSNLYATFINSAQKWNCTNKSCHGPTSGVAPIISDKSAPVARKQLLNYMMASDVPKKKYYIDKCNKDPAASSFTCNLKTESNITTCGSAMPKLGYNNVQASPATAAEVQQFAAWIACGAPDN